MPHNHSLAAYGVCVPPHETPIIAKTFYYEQFFGEKKNFNGCNSTVVIVVTSSKNVLKFCLSLRNFKIFEIMVLNWLYYWFAGTGK